MLIGNGRLINKIPMSFLGRDWTGQLGPGALVGLTLSDRFGAGAAIPVGYYSPHGWVLPRKAGYLSANDITGNSSASATGQSGYNIDSTITGEGGVTNAPLGLIVTIAATLIASGGISSAAANALANLVASITGSSDVSAVAEGLAALGASLVGSGSAVGSNTHLMDLASTIRGYGELTPEGLRDAVWDAVAVNFNNAGTMGNKVNSASASGDPWGAIIDSGLTAQDIMQILVAVAAGKTSITDLGGGEALVKFRNIANTKDVVVADMEGSVRVNTTLDVS